jgi:glycerate 2-kinase
MKILIAADSFKDALPSLEICEAIERGIRQVMPDTATVVFPMADGGEGTASVLAHHLEGSMVSLTVNDPLFRPVRAKYFLSKNDELAFLELAEASGLQRLGPAERNPLVTTTLGTGELLAHAIMQGAKKIVLGIGGSATNDGGMGMAAALGWRFISPQGKELRPTGKNLGYVHHVSLQSSDFSHQSSVFSPQIEVICDVDNPLLGPQGAARVYARQKGADAAAIGQLEAGMRHFAAVLKKHFGKDFSSIPGAGAAGGLGAGAVAFAGATLRPGIEVMMELTGFERQLEDADLLVTGEGKLDGQTARNKLISGICKKAAQHDVPVVAFCGAVEANQQETEGIGLAAAIAISPGAQPLEQALGHTARNLENAAFQWFQTYHGIRDAPNNQR